jgi:hypothetical protein
MRNQETGYWPVANLNSHRSRFRTRAPGGAGGSARGRAGSRSIRADRRRLPAGYRDDRYNAGLEAYGIPSNLKAALT